MAEDEVIETTGEEIEIECPKCGTGKHKAIVLRKVESGKRVAMEVQCKDCGSKGKIIIIGDLGIEIMEFP